MNRSDSSGRLDQATQQRLSRLASVSVDVSGLQRRLRAELDAAAPRPSASPWGMPARAWGSLIAATLVVVATLVFTLGTPSPATAAPGDMLRLHQSLIAGEQPVQATPDAAAVRTLVLSPWSSGDPLTVLPDAVAQACCLHEVRGKPVVGMLLQTEGRLVTVVMADAQRLSLHAGRTVEHGGRSYAVDTVDGTPMVMTQVHDRLLCFMGGPSEQSLLEWVGSALEGV